MLGFGLELELELIFTGLEGIGDVEDAGVLAQFCFDSLRNFGQSIEARAGQLDIDGRAAADPGGAEAYFLGSGNGAYHLSKHILHLIGIDIDFTPFGRVQFHDHFASFLNTGPEGAATGPEYLAARGAEDVSYDRLAILGLQLFL